MATVVACTARLWLLMAAALIMLPPPSAEGHLLKGAHLLALVARNIEGGKTLRVEQRVYYQGSAPDESPAQLKETLYFLFPDRFRLDSGNEDNPRIYIRSGDRSIGILDGQYQGEGESRFDGYKDLLLYRSRHDLHRMLLRHGVDTGITSLGRYEDRVVYVIGAQFPDQSPPQLWVDKESFLPLRWIFVGDASDLQETVEFTYRDWQKKDNLWYPVRIEILNGGQIVRRIETTELQVDVDLSHELFDISKLLQAYPQERVEANPASIEKPTEEVQRTIEEFQKKFED